jgi:hypothetical protein
MAETTADVRRDIELTRERMSTTLQQLEQKLNIRQVVRDNPWPALAVAVGAGVLLSGSRSDVKAANATTAVTHGAGSKVGSVLDDVVASLVGGLHQAFESRVSGMVDEIKSALGLPVVGQHGAGISTEGTRSQAMGSTNPLDGGAGTLAPSGTVGIQATRAD